MNIAMASNMRELSVSEIAMVGGAGQMSTETKITVGVLAVVSPLACAAFLIGYYNNRDSDG